LLGAEKEILREAQSLLKKDYDTIIAAHSLISLVCPFLGNLMIDNGYIVSKIVTFGQPLLQNGIYNGNNYFRIMDCNDIVTTIFGNDKKADGVEVILLAGKYHTTRGLSTEPMTILDINECASYHDLQNYLKRIQPKLKESVLVSFAESQKYRLEDL